MSDEPIAAAAEEPNESAATPDSQAKPTWWAILDASRVLVGFSPDEIPGAPKVPVNCDLLDVPEVRYRHDEERNAFVPLNNMAGAKLEQIAIDALAPKALAELIRALANKRTVPAYCREWADEFFRSFDNNGNGKTDLIV